MNCAELLVRALEMEGIRYVFGVPGEENADFMMALEQSESIRFILTRHEQAAAFMADVHGRLTGDPAVCLGTLGPGATNLITGVANANMDRSPMLVVTGQGSSDRLHKESHQVMDVVGMFRPVTKWATSIRHAEATPEIVRKAVRLARSEKPGACHIELPEDVAQQEVDAAPMAPHRYPHPVADPGEIEMAFAMIRRARRPLILVGNGCVRRGVRDELRRFCARNGIGVISTFMAKGVVDMDADYCLYTIGLQAKDVVACALDGADLVITIGYDLVEYHPRLWNRDGSKQIIHIDTQPAEIDRCYHPEIEIIGDLPYTLAVINANLDQLGPVERNLSQQRAVRRAMQQELADDAPDRDGLIRPQKVLAITRAAMGPEDVLLSDVGAHKMWIARHYHCHEPNTCLIPNGFCSMGFALPGAIAAALIHPERRILAICGDGGFLMNVQEMETARRLGVNLVAMVWEDHGYGLIAWKQQSHFGHHTELGFGNPDWLGLAAAFGWHGHRVKDGDGLRAALETAFTEEGPSLLVVPIDYRENMKLSARLGSIACPI
ncbi:MAG: acetolactate synthase large subunit [Zetaproteobacteria bacterium]|nr:MAG: acetolactate synthase large subunit [Zetaproteobacteria bacterium]